jgi:sarcosine oxidase
LQKAEIVIIGGGVIGSAIAYFTAVDPAFQGRILVIEKDPTYAEAATARSAGGIRQQFSTPENIRMSIFGAAFVKAAAEHLSLPGERVDLPFVENGYLFLATAAGLPVLARNHALQTELGAEIAFLDPAGLRQRFPWLNTEDLAGGSHGLANEGWTDPYSLLQAFRRKAIQLGVEYRKDAVAGMLRESDRITAVELAGGERIACGAAVDAAGIGATGIARTVGVELPVRPRKRFVFVFDCREPIRKAPLTIDPSGVYFRPEGASFICGVSPEEAEDRDCTDLEVEYELFENAIWPTLAHRVPAFEAIKLVRAWAGHYDYNTLDQNAILGRVPGFAKFFLANGFSGHGLQQSPAVGRAIAELLVHGRYRTLDLSRFGFERVLAGQPLAELNVV